MGIVDTSFLDRARRAVRRRRRPLAPAGKPVRERSQTGIGLALTATFMGVMLVRSIADAADAGPSDAAHTTPAEATTTGNVGTSDGWGGEHTVAASGPLANAAAGSMLFSGAFIDPVALARMSGEARLAETGEGFTTVQPTEQAVATAADAVTAVGDVQITFGDMPMPTLPTAEDVGTGEDVGPIGDVVVGTDGDDTIVGTDDNDNIQGGAGNDDISGLGGDDLLDGGSGDDTIDGGAGDDTVLGGTGNDVLDGGAGNDVVDGGEGDDQLQGGTGQDELSGGAGNDDLDGGAGRDVMTGGVGDDTIHVGEFGDLAFENPWGADLGGNDTLVAAPDFGAQLEKAFPTLAKGGVATFMIGHSVVGPVPTGGNEFKFQVAPNVENVRLQGTEAHDVVGDDGANVVEGNDGANLVWGGGGDDEIRGGGGDDRLYGQDGDDLLLGDAGNDWLDGGDGTDQLYGGGGDDVFVLGLAEGRSAMIHDYEGSNKLLLQGGEADALGATLDGDDLHLAHDGQEIAVIKGYALAPQAYSGIDLGDGHVHALDGFLAPTEPAAAPLPDILARFVDPGAASATVADTGGMMATGAEPTELAALDDAIAMSAQFAGADLWIGGDEPSSNGAVRPGEEARHA